MLFFKLGKVLVHFIIASWIQFKLTIPVPVRSYNVIYITCTIKYWQMQLFNVIHLLLTCPRSNIRAVAECNRSLTWMSLSLKPFPKALAGQAKSDSKRIYKNTQ